MADEIHETRAPDGTTHTTTIIDREPRRGGGMGFGLILLVLIAVAGFVAFQFLANEKTETGAKLLMAWDSTKAELPFKY